MQSCVVRVLGYAFDSGLKLTSNDLCQEVSLTLRWCLNKDVSLYFCFYGVQFIIELGKTHYFRLFLLLRCSCLESIDRELLEPGVDSGILSVEFALGCVEGGQMG